jgi:hypothetical protein
MKSMTSTAGSWCRSEFPVVAPLNDSNIPRNLLGYAMALQEKRLVMPYSDRPTPRLPCGSCGPIQRAKHASPYCRNNKESHGNKPIINHSNRAPLRRSLFISSVTMVARPVSVRPSMVCWSSAQPKCVSQACLRGLNNATSAPVSGSIPETLSAIVSLQGAQANARLPGASEPPCTKG